MSGYSNGAMTTRAIEVAPSPQLWPAERLITALEMADLGIQMKRRSLAPDDPEADPEVIEERLRDWLAAKA